MNKMEYNAQALRAAALKLERSCKNDASAAANAFLVEAMRAGAQALEKEYYATPEFQALHQPPFFGYGD